MFSNTNHDEISYEYVPQNHKYIHWEPWLRSVDTGQNIPRDQCWCQTCTMKEENKWSRIIKSTLLDLGLCYFPECFILNMLHVSHGHFLRTHKLYHKQNLLIPSTQFNSSSPIYYFTCILSFHHNPKAKLPLWIPFHQWQNWGSEFIFF